MSAAQGNGEGMGGAAGSAAARTDATDVLASYDFLDSAVNAVKELRGAEFRDYTIYMPYPEHELEEAAGYKESPVRVWTLVGGLTGAATGFAFTSFSALDWPLVTGGKPIVSIPPYVVIAFELAILFGALATVIGLFISARIPKFAPLVVYDPEFSAGRYGIHVRAEGERLDEARRILEAEHPTELREDFEAPGDAAEPAGEGIEDA